MRLFLFHPKGDTLAMLNLLVWWRVMHKFKIGERLFPARSVGFSVPDVAYVVVKRLPMRDGEFEYQMRRFSLSQTSALCAEFELRPKPLGNRPGRSSA